MKNRKPIHFKNGQGVKYKVVWREPTPADLKDCRVKYAYGVCETPDKEKPKIIIDPGLSSEKELKVLIEEITHSWFFDQPENLVRPFARTLAEIILVLGWTREDKSKKSK